MSKPKGSKKERKREREGEEGARKCNSKIAERSFLHLDWTRCGRSGFSLFYDRDAKIWSKRTKSEKVLERKFALCFDT